ncbi:efflux RND transporter permease subunit, partial [Aliarcobacter butzleri]
QYDLSILEIKEAIEKNNNDSGARILLENGYERIISARAYLKSKKDIEDITIKTLNNIPLKIKDIAEVNLTSTDRRGVAELNGEGETVGGIVV